MILKIIEYCFYDTYDKICSRTVLCATYIAELSNVAKTICDRNPLYVKNYIE